MFLNIRKIGKAKHKFKAKFGFLKVVNEATPKGVCFKILIQRGSHSVQQVSEPSRRGVGKFSKSEYQMPVTLFYDEDSAKYIEKQAIIKIYETDETGKQHRKIGTKTIDLAEYAQQGELKLQVQVDPQKTNDSPFVTLKICLERQNDDSKSVETSSNNENRSQNDTREPKDQELKKTPKIEQKQKSQVRSNKASQRTRKKDDSPIKYGPEDFQKDQAKIKVQQPKVTDAVLESRDQTEKNVINLNNQDGSPELQVFLLKKMLKQKQIELVNIKKQNEKLKKTVEKMIQQTSIAKEAERKVGLESEIKQLKKVVVAKDTQIDRLTTENKTLTAREENYEKTIVKLREETFRNKQKICDMKYRQAYLMQELFETANKEGLEEASRFLAI